MIHHVRIKDANHYTTDAVICNWSKSTTIKGKAKNNTPSELLQDLISKSETEAKFTSLTHGGVKLVML
jgi:hypothetical protein